MSSHSLKSRLEKLKQPSLTKGKKQEKSSCNVRRDAPLSTNPETPKPEQQGPTAIVDRSPRYEPVSQPEKEHNHAPGQVCPACEKRKEMRATPAPHMLFSEASDVYIEARTINVPNGRIRYVSDRTLSDYRDYQKALLPFFGNLRLADMGSGNLAEYQRLRAIGGENGIKWPKGAGANKIIQELGFLIRILRAAGAWTSELDSNFYHLQRIESDIGRALSPAEQDHWLGVSSSQDRWHFIWWYTLFAIHSVARTNELRSLRFNDVDMLGRLVYIRVASAKTRIPRTVPLNQEGFWALERIVERAKSMGGHLPQHFLFPLRTGRDVYDPSHPMTVSGLKRRWREVCEESKIKWTPYGTRHTGCTRLAEAGEGIQVIMSMAGHMTRQMAEHYCHISEHAKRRAVEKAFKPQSVSLLNGSKRGVNHAQ